MPGLLDSLAANPEGFMALSAGLLGGNLAGGIAGYGQATAQKQKDALQAQLIGAQLKNYDSEIEARKLATLKDQRLQGLLGSVFGPQAASLPQGQLGSGSFGIMPTTDGASPYPAASPTGSSAMSRITPDKLAALKIAGVDLTDIAKYANVPTQLSANSFSQLPGQAPTYNPDPTKGLGFSGGRIAALPGSEVLADLAGQTARAQEGAKAAFDLVKVVNGASGAEEYVPRTQALAAAQPRTFGQPKAAPVQPPARPSAGVLQPLTLPADSDRPAILSQELQGAQARLAAARTPVEQQRAQNDIAALGREMAAAGIPAQGGPMQATPTNAQRQTQAFDTALAGKQAAQVDDSYTKAQSAKQALPTLWQAQEILKGGTFTGMGADAKLNIVRALGAIGVPMPDSVANSQTFDATISQIVGANLKNIVGSTNISNADVQFVEKMFGQRGQEAKAIKYLLDKSIESNFRTINNYNGTLGEIKGAGGNSMLGNVSAPAKPASASSQRFETLPKDAQNYKGQTMTDETTGARYRSNGLSWVKEGK